MIGANLTFDLIILILATVLAIYFIEQTKRGKAPYIRPLPAVEALPEVAGRAAEMGRPIHYTCGQCGLSGWAGAVAPIMAGLLVYGELIKLTAKSGSKVICTISRPEVMPVAEDIAISAAIAAGHPEVKPDVRYISTSPRSYMSGIMGIIAREKVAGNVVIGMLGEESLTTLDAGLSVGAMQIGGTASSSNAAWFITACDYFLIDEEIIATAAFLGDDPSIRGSLAGEDITKLIVIALMIIGAILTTAGITSLIDFIKL
jgi:hypothetical protein